MDLNKNIEKLNNKQKEAVLEKKSKRLLILAGAGSGKTSVLTTRIAYILKMGISASSIFAVTFTNKAAKEMKDRIIYLTGAEAAQDLTCGTFHSTSLKIIKDNINKTNITKNFTIVDSDDQKLLIKKIILEMLKENPKIFNLEVEDVKEIILLIQSFINNAKENEFRPENCNEIIKKLNLPLIYKEVYERYEEYRIINNILDFSDILLYAVEILRDNANIREFYSNKYRHIFVDEFQDTNPIQYRLINLITTEKTYHTMVGDDDQLIYAWRGANLDNLKKYTEENQKEIKIIKLEQNYRSVNNILNAANNIIKNNEKRLGKNLWSDKKDGEKITIIEGNNQEEEASLIANKIYKLIKSGYKPSDITVLYRRNSLSRAIESHLTKKKIPYKVIGGLSFWQRKEIKDIMSYLLMVNNNNNDIAFERTINTPKRGMGDKTLEKIREFSKENKLSMYSSVEKMLNDNIFSGKIKTGFENYIELIKNSKKYENNINQLINFIVFETKIEDEYQKEGNDIYLSRKENISELINYSSYFIGNNKNTDILSDFLQTAQLQSDADKNNDIDTVKLMTVHSSKGLEFPIVFIIGLEDGIFPSNQSITMQKLKPELLEEERRLAYVAITRAKEILFLTFSNSRYYINSTYSRFLEEIPLDLLKHEDNNSFSISKIGQKIKKNMLTKNKNGYKIGDKFNDDIFGVGEIISISEEGNYNVLEIDFDFLGKQKKYIEK